MNCRPYFLVNVKSFVRFITFLNEEVLNIFGLKSIIYYQKQTPTFAQTNLFNHETGTVTTHPDIGAQ